MVAEMTDINRGYQSCSDRDSYWQDVDIHAERDRYNDFSPLTTILCNCAPCPVCGGTERGAQLGGSRATWCRTCLSWFPDAGRPANDHDGR